MTNFPGRKRPNYMDSNEQSRMERQHVFVVNASPDFLDVVRELLQEEEYNVTTTNFVPKTFDQIATLDPALLIVDLVSASSASAAFAASSSPR